MATLLRPTKARNEEPELAGSTGEPLTAEALLKRIDWTIVRKLDGILQGDYRSMFTGQGYDLAEVREYQAEDDPRYMDWNVTARMDTPYVRQYIEEREITAWLLLDMSPSVDFGTANQRKRDTVVDFAGVMARLLTRHGNKVGAMIFSHTVEDVLPPRSGQNQILQLVHQLIRPERLARANAARERHAKKKRNEADREDVTDLKAILDRAGETLKRKSVVFVVSDFISPEGWDIPLARLAQKHEVIAVWLNDPREEELPAMGPLVLEDSETGEQVYVDTSDKGFQERFAVLVAERRAKLERTFARFGVDVIRLTTDADLVQTMLTFAQMRKERSRRGNYRVSSGATL
jgi:uncharacterized protein (DUF58 family)